MLEAFGALAEKLDLRRAEPDEVLRRHGNRPVDTEDRDLEFVSCIPQSLRWRVLDPRTGEAQAADLGYVVGRAGREAQGRSRVGQKETAIDFLLPPPTLGDLLVQVGRTQMTRPIRLGAVATLREHLRGRLISPNDTGYDTARRVWNGRIDRRPSLIAFCADEKEVVVALRF